MKFTLLYITIVSLLLPLPFYAQSDRGVRAKTQDSQTSSEKRLALVIGNSTYSNTSSLMNPANDAADMASTLKSLGFEVLSGTNQSKRQMETLIRQFGEKLAQQGGVGLFFYAGHGLQVSGNNYLIPVEAEIPTQDEVEYAAVNLGFLLGKMEAAENDLNIVILDACRNNPFAGSWRGFRDGGEGKGLAKITPPTGTIMLYATQPGNVASDGAGRNGLFTESLLKQINKPNIELDQMIKLLARDISEKSGRKQLPWKEGIILGDFYFAGISPSVSSATNIVQNGVQNPPASVIDPAVGEREAWNQIKDSKNRSDFAMFIESFPKGIYAKQAQTNWEQVWWNSIKNSKNQSDFAEFLKIFPNGQYLDAAEFAVKRLETASIPAGNPTDLESSLTASQTAGAISKVQLSKGVEMTFAFIPAGEFQMGSNKGPADETPTHTVKISHNFFLGQTEVTQAQWKAVMGVLPSLKCGYSKSSNKLRADNKPIICVSWEEVQEFVRKMNTKADGYHYRLPSEAEWEYAARAGTLGDDERNLDTTAWYRINSGEITHEVATKKANAWNLYDMRGNVWEWCEDWHFYYDNKSLAVDPAGPAKGSDKVTRGGSWNDSAEYVRLSGRDKRLPSIRLSFVGFRLLRLP